MKMSEFIKMVQGGSQTGEKLELESGRDPGGFERASNQLPIN